MTNYMVSCSCKYNNKTCLVHPMEFMEFSIWIGTCKDILCKGEIMKRLNRKLALWAGWTFTEVTIGNPFVPTFTTPSGEKTGFLPNFIKSLDDCFKYLVPKSKMDILWIINDLDATSTPEIKYCFGTCRDYDICWSTEMPNDDCLSPIAESPALAICLAIEKLIDA